MIKITLSLTFTFLLLFSCIKHPATLEKCGAFDLERVNFQENVSLLYSRHLILKDGYAEYDSIRDGKLTDDMLRYTINTVISDALELKVPKEEFGYLYQTPTLDSVAKFRNAYFDKLSILTNREKKPVAYYATGRFNTLEDRAHFMNGFKEKYGQPKYSFFISSHFEQCSFEWDLQDRIIQIETSHGFEFSVSSGGSSSNGKYYNLYLLIIEKQYQDAIYKAHLYEFSDSIKHEGKTYSLKDLGLEKEVSFSDSFLLNSTNERYTNDEYGEYHISRSEEYSEKFDSDEAEDMGIPAAKPID